MASLGAVLLLIPFEIVKCTQFDVLRACSGGVLFFFFQPAAGLTNRVPVRDSQAGVHCPRAGPTRPDPKRARVGPEFW